MENEGKRGLRARYEVKRNEKSSITVSQDMRHAIKVYAINRGLTMTDAAYRLLV